MTARRMLHNSPYTRGAVTRFPRRITPPAAPPYTTFWALGCPKAQMQSPVIESHRQHSPWKHPGSMPSASGHTIPHPPQWCHVSLVSTHPEPKATSHLVWPAGQGLEGSARSTHTPSHSGSPSPQISPSSAKQTTPATTGLDAISRSQVSSPVHGVPTAPVCGVGLGSQASRRSSGRRRRMMNPSTLCTVCLEHSPGKPARRGAADILGLQ